MQTKQREGHAEELLVADLLRKKGFVILEQNYQVGHLELDLIVMEQDVLCFVEVKSRKSEMYLEDIEVLIPKRKIRNVVAASDSYCQTHPTLKYKRVRFDVALLHIPDGQEPKLTYIRDAFVPIL